MAYIGCCGRNKHYHDRVKIPVEGKKPCCNKHTFTLKERENKDRDIPVFCNEFFQKTSGIFHDIKKGMPENPASPFSYLSIMLHYRQHYCSFSDTAPLEQTLMHVSQPSHESA
jgi:hypothetical protein